MAKSKPGTGMSHKTDRKTRGRSSISGNVGTREMGKGDVGPSATKPNVPEILRAEANRPVTANGNMNKHRGDRRDMNRTYTGNERHAACVLPVAAPMCGGEFLYASASST